MKGVLSRQIKEFIIKAPAVLLVLLLIFSSLIFTFTDTAAAHDSSLSSLKLPEGNRLVIQYIEGNFHKWYEYEDSEGLLQVYLIEPENKMLSITEKEKLFYNSRKWLKSISSMPQVFPVMQEENCQVSPALQLQAMTDNRTFIGGSKTIRYPYNNTGFLTIDYEKDYLRGTAFMVSPHVALTNGHNIYAKANGGWFKSITFSPGQYETVWPNAVRPFGTIVPASAETNEYYIQFDQTGTRTQAIKYDYAALFFNETFSAIDTFAPLEFNLIPEEVIVIGYPGVVRDANSLGMWKAEGTILNYDLHCLYYDAYTSGGSSGSPILVYNQEADTYRVAGIHSFASPNSFSGGPHFNSINRTLIESWVRWSPSGAATPENAEELIITLNRSSLTLSPGDREALIAAVTGKDNKVVLNWSSSNPSVITVDANGVVSALQPGTAVITVQESSGNASAKCNVIVNGESVSTKMGDLNGDNIVNVQDVALVLRHVLHISPLGSDPLVLADINQDGEVNVVDATILMQYVLGLIESF